MIKWMQRVFKITERLNEQKRTNLLLEQLIKECKRNSDLVEAYNRAYQVR